MRAFMLVLVWPLDGSFMVNEPLADWPQFRGPAGNGPLGQLNHPS